MTVTTNAMLERRFAPTALLATTGFTDIEELARQNRPSLYRLCEAPPRPIVRDELRFGLTERCGPDGVTEPLDESSVIEALASCARAGVESIAVCLLFSFRHPEHELRVRELARDVLPGIHVSLSHEVVGTFREYERCATTIANAALVPLLAGYLEQLGHRAEQAGLPKPDVMLSNGGTVAAPVAARNAAATVLSGPAGGMVGTAKAAARARERRALGFDMGGTSTDVSLVEDGAIRVTSSREIDGRPIALPAADIFTVGAGGGSIAWRDSGGALRVGPRSAGAAPGPACYGRGGTEPTVTDANLMLGYLSGESSLAGGLRLDIAAAERAVGGLAESLALEPLETAAGIIGIANLEMLRATGAMTIARGIDPRDHAMVAFGGAGPMHAAAIAEALGVQTIICPPACGVLSAYGMALTGRRRDRSRSVVEPLDGIDPERWVRLVDDLAAEARADLDATGDAVLSTVFELRYRGQSFELPLEAGPRSEPAALAELFHDAHQSRYGFCDRELPVELVTLRATVALPGAEEPEPPVVGDRSPRFRRVAYFDGTAHDTSVIRGNLVAGESIDGPAIFELAQATLVVPPRWRAERSADGGITLRHRAEAR
jgi:N-methylhydantoinase A